MCCVWRQLPGHGDLINKCAAAWPAWSVCVWGGGGGVSQNTELPQQIPPAIYGDHLPVNLYMLSVTSYLL